MTTSDAATKADDMRSRIWARVTSSNPGRRITNTAKLLHLGGTFEHLFDGDDDWCQRPDWNVLSKKLDGVVRRD